MTIFNYFVFILPHLSCVHNCTILALSFVSKENNFWQNKEIDSLIFGEVRVCMGHGDWHGDWPKRGPGRTSENDITVRLV